MYKLTCASLKKVYQLDLQIGIVLPPSYIHGVVFSKGHATYRVLGRRNRGSEKVRVCSFIIGRRLTAITAVCCSPPALAISSFRQPAPGVQTGHTT